MNEEKGKSHSFILPKHNISGPLISCCPKLHTTTYSLNRPGVHWFGRILYAVRINMWCIQCRLFYFIFRECNNRLTRTAFFTRNTVDRIAHHSRVLRFNPQQNSIQLNFWVQSTTESTEIYCKNAPYQTAVFISNALLSFLEHLIHKTWLILSGRVLRIKTTSPSTYHFPTHVRQKHTIQMRKKNWTSGGGPTIFSVRYVFRKICSQFGFLF